MVYPTREKMYPLNLLPTWPRPTTSPVLRVAVQGSEIVVTASDSDYVMTYHKPANSPQLLARSFPRKEDRRVSMTLANFLTSETRQRQGSGVGVDSMTEQPFLNTGKEWSKKDLFSLFRNRIEHGRTVAHIATFLMRTETEVREKAAELGLTLPQ